MRREQFDVGGYYRLSPRKRIDGIMRNIDGFPVIMDNYERKLSEWIADNRAKKRRDAVGNLGVRIQSGRNDFSLTEANAQEKLEIEAIMKNYELTPSCKGIEDYDEIRRGLLELFLMRREYGELISEIKELPPRYRKIFKRYILRDDRADAFAEELSISVKAVWNKMYRIKRKIYDGYVNNLDTYDDVTILYVRRK